MGWSDHALSRPAMGWAGPGLSWPWTALAVGLIGHAVGLPLTGLS
jgi:hypothetical protein